MTPESIASLIAAYGLTPILGAGLIYLGYKYLPAIWIFIKQANENSALIKSVMERLTLVEAENAQLRVEYNELEEKYEKQGEELGNLKTQYEVLKERFGNLQDRFEDKLPQARGRKVA